MILRVMAVCGGALWLAAGSLHAVSAGDFGAAGDGKTDDAPAFRKAIAEAAKLGEPVKIGVGRFYLGSTLLVDEAVTFAGKGHQQSVITSNGGAARIVVRESGTEFRGIGFEEMTEPIALESRADLVLRDLVVEHCRFEEILVRDSNRGAIGLSSGNAAQREHRIENLTIRENLFRNIDAHAINIRANLSGAQVADNVFLDIVNQVDSKSPNGGYAIRLGDSSEHGKSRGHQGNHVVSGNVIRGLKKTTVEGNLMALLIYGDHNTISQNRIEEIDGTSEGMDTNAMYIRGSFNRIVSNVIRNVRGADDDGALCLKGGMANGNHSNMIAYNIVEDIDGMSAVEVSTSGLLFFENRIENAPVRGFYHRTGRNVSVTENAFTRADIVLRTSQGTALVSGNRLFESRLLLEQRRGDPSAREAVLVHGNRFQRRLAETKTPLIRFGNNVEEQLVSLRENRIQNLASGIATDADGSVIDLASNGTLREVEMIGNFFDQAGSESALLRIGSGAAGGRFAGNTIVVRDLRGPVVEAAFAAIENNTVHIPAAAEKQLSMPAVFVVAGHNPDATIRCRNNRLVNETEHVRIGSMVKVRGAPAEVVSEGNVMAASFEQANLRPVPASVTEPRVADGRD